MQKFELESQNIILCQKNDIVKEIQKYKSTHLRQKKKKIPKTLKTMVWNNNFGSKCGESECYIGCGKMIQQMNFECGHVIAEIHGGDINIDNLKPICGQCNRSMSTINLEEFKKTYFGSRNKNSIDDKIIVTQKKKTIGKTYNKNTVDNIF